MTNKNGKRINARLPEDVANKLDELVHLSKENISQVIINSIESYYTKLIGEQVNPLQIFGSSGFIASGSCSKNLSTDYKKILSKSLGNKL